MAHLIGKNISAGYQQVDIVKHCDIEVSGGEIVVIVGPNGAGKSTAMKTLLGMAELRTGQVLLDDQDISLLSTQARIKLGISFVPQTHNIFTSMTVTENLEMGAFIRQDNYQDTIDDIFNLFPILKNKRNQLAGQLSGGQRQQLAIGRAMMTKPSILMLDEPTAGVSPVVMNELFEYIIAIKKNNLAVLMVEQNAQQALNIADRGYVLVMGKNKYSDTGQNLLNNAAVRASFLGG